VREVLGMTTERYLTVPEVAAITTESEDTTRRRCATGQLPAVKLGRAWRVPESAVHKFLSPGVRPTPRRRLTKRQREQLGITT